MEKKKVVVVTLIGILTLVILTIGATYAYFQFNSQNNFDTGVNIQGSTEAIGTGAVLKSVTKSLTLDVSATDMLESNIGTSYYASGSSTPATIGEISVDMDGNYACTYTVVVRDTASSYENNLITKAFDMPSASRSGEYAEQFYLDINDKRYYLNTAEIFSIIHTERVIIDKNNPYNITTNLVLTNTDVDQTALSGGDITLNYEVMDFNCEYMGSDDVVDTTVAYAIYSADDTSLTLYNNDDVKSVNAGDTYNNKTVTAVYTINANDKYEASSCTAAGSCTTLTTPWNEYATDITSIKIEDEIHPWNTSAWFAGLINVSNIDVTNLKMDEVVDMSRMFLFTSSNVTNIEVSGISEFDTSNVINMEYLFSRFGYNATAIDLDLSNWNTSNVRTLVGVFGFMGQNSSTFDIGNIGSWDVSKVESISSMFYWAGRLATTWSIGDLSDWDVSNIINMAGVFEANGRNATSWNIGDLSSWNVSKVKNMRFMFRDAGYRTTNWNIGDLSNWNVSNVYSMQSMFYDAGRNATTFNIGDISKWDTSNVTRMNNMFYNAGLNADYSLDLSTWNVDNVIQYDSFNAGVTTKVTPPTWVN